MHFLDYFKTIKNAFSNWMLVPKPNSSRWRGNSISVPSRDHTMFLGKVLLPGYVGIENDWKFIFKIYIVKKVCSFWEILEFSLIYNENRNKNDTYLIICLCKCKLFVSIHFYSFPIYYWNFFVYYPWKIIFCKEKGLLDYKIQNTIF